MNMNKQEWQALRRLYRDLLSQGCHYHVAAVMAANEAVVSHGVRAGFALRNAGKLPACHPGWDSLDGTVIVPEV